MAYGVSWPMSWLATILTAAFLATGHRARLQATLAILLAIAIIFGAGLLLTLHFYHYPLVFALLVSLGLYLNFYLAARGGSKFIVLLCTMAILLIPLVGGTDPGWRSWWPQGFLIVRLRGPVLHPGRPYPATRRHRHTGPNRRRSTPTPPAPPGSVPPSSARSPGVYGLRHDRRGSTADHDLFAVAEAGLSTVGAAGGKALIAANLGGGLIAMAVL